MSLMPALRKRFGKKLAEQSPTDNQGWQMRFADLRRVATENKSGNALQAIQTTGVDTVQRNLSTETGGNTISVQIISNTQQVSEAHLRFK